MLGICLLGAGGVMLPPYCWLTSTMARCSGSNLLIDHGEGTQVALKERGQNPKPIDVICFTHYHVDHTSGLPGLLLTMGNTERVEPLILIGPKGLERVVGALRTIAPELPFELRFVELTRSREHIQMGPYVIDAYRVNYNVLCYGYSITTPHTGRFGVERARSQKIPQKFWSRLQRGEEIEHEGRLLTPDVVLGPDRRGLKVTYCTDTGPVPAIAEYAAGAGPFICEGIYREKEKAAKAREHKHVMFYEAAALVKQVNPKQIQLTHYSPSLTRPEEYMEEVRSIFPRARAARNGWTAELEFDED